MKKYIGIKLILATAISRLEYNEKRKWTVPEDENPNDEGYMVEYLDSPNANTDFSPYYVSWSPKDVFEKAYRATDEMTFGLAIEALKMGHRVARKGWNGKGIFLELQTPTKTSKMTSPYIYIDTTGLQGDNKYAPKSLVPWLASQTDMLAEDWVII